jgi:autotransporter-associated beta strand protein
VFRISGGSIDNTSGAAVTLSNNNVQTWGADFVFKGTNDLNLGTGAVTLSANRTVTVSVGTLTVGGVVSGGYSLTKAGSGALTLSGANTFSGGLTLSAGTLNINSTTALGAAASSFTLSGGSIDNTSGSALTLSNNNAQTWSADFVFKGTNDLNLGTGAVTLSANRTVTVSAGTLTEGGVMSGSYSLTKAGSGAVTLSGANTFSGGLTLSAGTLNLNSTTAVGSGSLSIAGATVVDNLSGGALTLSNNNAQVWSGDFTFRGTNDLNLGTGAVTLGANRIVTVSAGTLTEGGVISGAYSLTKSGSGALTLSGANTFSGGLTLSAGALNINNSKALGAAASVFTISAGSIDNPRCCLKHVKSATKYDPDEPKPDFADKSALEFISTESLNPIDSRHALARLCLRSATRSTVSQSKY